MAQYNTAKTCTGGVGSSNRLWRILLNAAAENRTFPSFLEDFFRSRDADLDPATLRSNAECIVKAFPYYSVDYIVERLRVLGSEENSVGILLRQLLAKQGKSKASREANLRNLEKYCTEEAYAKADNGDGGNNNFAELNMFFSDQTREDSLNELVMNILERSKSNRSSNENGPSTSKDCTLVNEANLKNLEKYCTEEAYAKVDDDDESDGGNNNFTEPDMLFSNHNGGDDFENRPSTSRDCTINKPCSPIESTAAVSSTSMLEMLCSFEVPRSSKCEIIPNSPTDLMDEKLSTSDSEEVFDTVKETIDEVIRSYSAGDTYENFASPYVPIAATAPDLLGPERHQDFYSARDDFRRPVIRPPNFQYPRPKYVTNTVTVRQERSSNTTGSPGKIDLVAYLKELFPGKSELDIKVSCLRNGIDVNAMPEDPGFDLLVRDLSSDEPFDLSIFKNYHSEETRVEASEEGIPFNEGEDNHNEEDGKTEEPPAAKRVKTNDGSSGGFRFRIVRANDTQERRFVRIPRTDENASSSPTVLKQRSVHLSDTDSCDDLDDDEMDMDAEEEEQPELDVPQTSYDNNLLSKIAEIFPDACPIYIRRLCTGKVYSHEVIDEIMNHIFSIADYPKRRPKSPSPEPDWDPEKQLSILKEILPDADPAYLQYKVELHVNDQEKLKDFISNAIENRDYPTLKDYLRKQQLSAQTKQYTGEFKVEKFLEVIPDPEAYFNDPQRKPTVTDNVGDMTYHYAFKVLRNMYLTLPIRLIGRVLARRNFNLVEAKRDLDKIVESGTELMKTKRKQLPITDATDNIPFLQVIAYLQHQNEIVEYIKTKEERERNEKDRVRAAGLLQTCNCCYDDEVMPNCIMTCENGCSFCKICIQKSVEIAFGENKLDFPCLGDCNSHFSLQTLQAVLSPKLFSKMAQKKQLEEVKAAGIEDLEGCPFCDFATIPAPGDKLFRCFNPECMKESCRECKEPSHIPLRCDEIEKDDDVKRRVYIENKMTEALLRKCYKCGLKFIKSDGCNKMTCSCGASMCYICGKPVKDYTHFNGQGGDQYHLCPLYSDTTQLHQEEVLRGAEEAKEEVGVNQDPSKLKIDPTADLEKHYQKERTRNPYNLPPGMNIGNAAPQVIGPDHNIYFHVGVRVNQNHVQVGHIHRHHHHHHLHPPQRRRHQFF